MLVGTHIRNASDDGYPQDRDRLTATRFVRRMRGGSQSCMLEASDGLLYVVKFLQNPQGPRVCFNEALSALLGAELGLPFPYSSPIFVSADICNLGSGGYEAPGGAFGSPEEGIHFASLVQADKLIHEVLPQAWCQRLKSRMDFLSILVFDIWAGHADCRQALFVENSDSTVSATFFDNGHMFWGPSSPFQVPHRFCAFLNLKVYEGLSMELETRLVCDKIVNLDRARLEQMVSQIPIEWVHSGVDDVIDRLLERRQFAEGILEGNPESCISLPMMFK